MEKIEQYKGNEIKVQLENFIATENYVEDENDINKILITVTYDYSQKILINGNLVLQRTGQTHYDGYMQNPSVDLYKDIALDNGILFGKRLIT